MSRRIALHSPHSPPTAESLSRWLTEQGEPFGVVGDVLRLRALPVTLEVQDEGVLASVDVDPGTPVVRLVDLLFDLSIVAGADVHVQGDTATRPGLWASLADEQDRQRIARALDQAGERGIRDEVLRRLWGVVHALAPGIEVRWSAEHHGIVALSDDGDGVGVLPGFPHLSAWRWLSEAYPSLVEEP